VTFVYYKTIRHYVYQEGVRSLIV